MQCRRVPCRADRDCRSVTSDWKVLNKIDAGAAPSGPNLDYGTDVLKSSIRWNSRAAPADETHGSGFSRVRYEIIPDVAAGL